MKLLTRIRKPKPKGTALQTKGVSITYVPGAYIEKFIYNDLGKMGLKQVKFLQ